MRRCRGPRVRQVSAGLSNHDEGMPLHDLEPVYEQHVKEHRYTVCKPIWETYRVTQKYTVCKPVYEQHVKEHRYTVCKPVLSVLPGAGLLDDLQADLRAAREGTSLHGLQAGVQEYQVPVKWTTYQAGIHAAREGRAATRSASRCSRNIRCRSSGRRIKPEYTQHVKEHRYTVCKPVYQEYQVPVKWTTCKPIYETACA